ncbi:MAG: hypothetical protein ACRCWQ_02730 [Bacilli bacterium]
MTYQPLEKTDNIAWMIESSPKAPVLVDIQYDHSVKGFHVHTIDGYLTCFYPNNPPSDIKLVATTTENNKKIETIVRQRLELDQKLDEASATRTFITTEVNKMQHDDPRLQQLVKVIHGY